jgi:hypothetical protein
MTSQGSARGRSSRAIRNRNVLNAEIAAREIGELSLPDALSFCLLRRRPVRSTRERSAKQTPEGVEGAAAAAKAPPLSIPYEFPEARLPGSVQIRQSRDS